MPSKFLPLFLLLLLPARCILAAEELPFATDHILVFIEPFVDQGPDTTQPWLEEGLSTFLRSALADERKLDAYSVPVQNAELYAQPHRLQDQIWADLFQREVDPAYDTYLVRGSYSLVDERLAVTVELYFLKSMHLADRLQLQDRYAQVSKWKALMGTWLIQRLATSSSVNTEVLAAEDFFPARSRHKPAADLQGKLEQILERKSRQSTTELFEEYERQSDEELGNQLERLWHDVAFDPYVATIHDIDAQRDREEPDSVQLTFQVTYAINPRILDEIHYFSRTRGAEISQEGVYQGYRFMDLGYTDQEFIHALAEGHWRLTPVITLGPENYPARRVLYHSDPMPIKPPSVYHHNQGQFHQLLMGLPGVNSLRIYTREEESTYRYTVRLGHTEMPFMDKIRVRFVLEKDLVRNL